MLCIPQAYRGQSPAVVQELVVLDGPFAVYPFHPERRRLVFIFIFVFVFVFVTIVNFVVGTRVATIVVRGATDRPSPEAAVE